MNQDKGILDELRELSPILLKMKEEMKDRQPFNVPNGYFEELKSDVFAYIDSGLADSAQSESFKVPENYFDELTGNIMDAVEAESAEENSGGRIINLNDARKREPIPMRRWTSMAAAVAIFILMGVVAARFLGGGDIDQNDLALSQDEAYEYLEDNMLSLDSDDLFAMVDFNEVDISQDVIDDLEDELHQYLEENIEDLEDYLLTVEI